MKNRNSKSHTKPSASDKKIANFRASYDAVSTWGHRRASSTETTAENGATSTQLPPWKRLQMLNLLRDSQRNFSTAKNIIRQLDINILGTDYKLTFKDNGEEYREAEKWFNEKFASHCYFNRRMALSEFQHLALQTILREGDMGLGFDRDILQTGRLMAYESD